MSAQNGTAQQPDQPNLPGQPDDQSRHRHGEYKLPGGKLVVVDLQDVDGFIRGFQLSGDFFLEPDHALDAINAAVEGMPADASARALQQRIESALSPEVHLVGVTVPGIVTALRRAITHATTWRDHEWQLVRTDPLPPRVHLALDQVLTEAVAAGELKPTLRIWNWNQPAIVIGSFQSVRNEVDLEAAARFDVPVVRRISGGGAMFMEGGNVVTYSLYAPASLVAGLSFEDSYAFLDSWVVTALRELGIDAYYKPLNDIASTAGKIGGAAQKRISGRGRTSGGVLHHVTMSYDIDADRMVQVLRIGREKLSDKGIRSANKRVDPLKSQTGLPREAIIDHMCEVFAKEHGLTAGTLSPEHLAAAEELAATKFSSDEWLYRVP